jgi:hypothetical protein
MQPSQYEKLKQIPEWQEKTREAIAKLLEETQLDSSTTQNTTATKPAGTIGEGGQIPANGTGQIAEENQTGNTGAKGKGKRSPRARATATKTTG